MVTPDRDGFVLPGILRSLDRERMSLPPMPTSSTVRKSDEAMSRSERGVCVSCGLHPSMEERLDCARCRGEEPR